MTIAGVVDGWLTQQDTIASTVLFVLPFLATHTHASCNHLYSTVKEEEEK